MVDILKETTLDFIDSLFCFLSDKRLSSTPLAPIILLPFYWVSQALPNVFLWVIAVALISC